MAVFAITPTGEDLVHTRAGAGDETQLVTGRAGLEVTDPKRSARLGTKMSTCTTNTTSSVLREV